MLGDRKLRKYLLDQFGKQPDIHYFGGDMEQIKTYYEYRRDQGLDSFLVDDITWNDLDMDKLFKRLNPGLSTSGEQYLYYMLRSPAINAEEYRERRALINFIAEHDDRRVKLQALLAKLGRRRRADLCSAFSPRAYGLGWFLFYLFFSLLLLAGIVAAVAGVKNGMAMLLLALTVNSLIHELCRKGMQKELDRVNYTVNMVFTLNKIKKLRDPELDKRLEKAYESLKKLRFVLRTGGVSTVTDSGGLGDVINTVLLLDLMAYEFLKNRLGKHHEEVFAVHESLGRIDAAIAIVSYRISSGHWTEPELDFDDGDRPSIQAKALVHPLLSQPVPNDLLTRRAVLITGSNASGKSTYLKAAAICAIMAQAICTCPAKSYKANAFRIFSSMALKDDLEGGESYYIVETRSLKRILDSIPGQTPLLCVIDEVLRGTNTVERVAASSRILQEMAERGAVCIAATHDVELCSLLEEHYELFHFEEQMGEGQMLFDYKIRPGRANSRNAIALLRLMGFDENLVEGAYRRANRYMETGVWR